MEHLRNIMDGVATVLGALGSFRPYDTTIPSEILDLDFHSDARSLRGDMKAVGEDMTQAVECAYSRDYFHQGTYSER